MDFLKRLFDSNSVHCGGADVHELRAILSTMNETLCASQVAAVALIADRKEMEEQLAELRDNEADWTRKATMLAADGRDELAREALITSDRLSYKIEQVEDEIGVLIDAQTKIEEELVALSDTHGNLQAAEARVRLRVDVATSQIDVRQALQDRELRRASLHIDGANREARFIEAKAEVLAVTAARPSGRAFGRAAPRSHNA